MFHKILVTLDGSDLSERALEAAFQIARQFEAEIVLLRVLTLDAVALAGGSTPQYQDLRQLQEKRDRQEAETYLHGLRANWQPLGVPISTRVVTGAPPEAILEVAEESGIDLIVMSTHGRTGLSRLLYGSVAEAVLRGTHLPVLLIPIR
jgi:nucleotide-binding universal stress UspA family protein